MPRIFRILLLLPFLFLPAIAQADPVPALTIISGTVTTGSFFAGGGLTFNLTGIDPATGTIYNISGGGEGGFSSDPALPIAGDSVTFSGSISGNLDLGFGTVEARLSGSGPPLPNVSQLTLDLQGTGTATIRGTFYANATDAVLGQNPIFTVDQSVSGPVTLHFIILQPGDPRYELKSATLTVSEPVPEPASVFLLLTSVAGLGLLRRRKI